MRETGNIINRELLRKRHAIVGDYGPPPVTFYSPNISESGLCMYGQTPEPLLPDYPFQYERPNRVQVPNPYAQLPQQGMYPPVRGNMRRIVESDTGPNNQVAQIIRDPTLRYVSDRKKPQGVFTMHGFRKFKTVKQIDPDLEETYKQAMLFSY